MTLDLLDPTESQSGERNEEVEQWTDYVKQFVSGNEDPRYCELKEHLINNPVILTRYSILTSSYVILTRYSILTSFLRGIAYLRHSYVILMRYSILTSFLRHSYEERYTGGIIFLSFITLYRDIEELCGLSKC